MKIKYLITLLILIILPIKVSALEVSAKNYILYNMDSDKIVLEKNSDEKISIASLTKIATAIAVIENTRNLNETVTITEKTLDGLKEANASVAGFYLGQKLTIEDLLYGLMLPSGADAANALDLYFKSRNMNLIKLMNDYTNKLNLSNTNFVNTTGLDDKNHYSSVSDVTTLLKYSLSNNTFKKIFTSKTYLTSDKKITLKASYYSAMEYYSIKNNYINGAKTGYETTAGLCLASISNFDNTNYILVTAGSPRSTYTKHITDSLNIYKHVDENFKNLQLFNKGDLLKYIPAKYSNVYQYNLRAPITYEIFNENTNNYTYKFVGIDELTPQTKKESIGNIYIYYNDLLIDKVEVYYDGSLQYSISGFISLHLNEILITSSITIAILLTTIIILKNKKSQ